MRYPWALGCLLQCSLVADLLHRLLAASQLPSLREELHLLQGMLAPI